MYIFKERRKDYKYSLIQLNGNMEMRDFHNTSKNAIAFDDFSSI